MLKDQIKYVIMDSELPRVVLFNGDSLLTNKELLNAVREARDGKFEESSSILITLLGTISIMAFFGIMLIFLYLHRRKRK